MHETEASFTSQLQSILTEVCPNSVAAKRKDYITEETWALRCFRKDVSRGLDRFDIEIAADYKRLWQSEIFNLLKKAWAVSKGKKEPTEFVPGAPTRAENAIEEKINAQSRTMHAKYRLRAWYIDVLKKTAGILQHRLKTERKREADAIVEQAKECDSPQKRAELYERTKGMRGSTARRRPRV